MAGLGLTVSFGDGDMSNQNGDNSNAAADIPLAPNKDVVMDEENACAQQSQVSDNTTNGIARKRGPPSPTLRQIKKKQWTIPR